MRKQSGHFTLEGLGWLLAAVVVLLLLLVAGCVIVMVKWPDTRMFFAAVAAIFCVWFFLKYLL